LRIYNLFAKVFADQPNRIPVAEWLPDYFVHICFFICLNECFAFGVKSTVRVCAWLSAGLETNSRGCSYIEISKPTAPNKKLKSIL